MTGTPLCFIGGILGFWIGGELIRIKSAYLTQREGGSIKRDDRDNPPEKVLAKSRPTTC
jgi:hypothetical protein